jgi:DNA-directed RNA polymerase
MQAVKWLAVHVSNTYGNDKVSLDDRYSWTVQNQEKILACAEDPLENDWWMDADSPFCFLAACKEWAGYVNEGLAFRSSLPIAMDGTCNGLQIFSLILRDEIGGRATNLVPMDMPQDIYGIVAQKVIDRIYSDSKNEILDVDVQSGSGKITFNKYRDAQALTCLRINRKTTKRQVMVMPYGGTMQSCIEYTKEWLSSQNVWHKNSLEFRKYSLVLAQYIWQEIGNTVVKAREAMSYLQGVARCINKLDKPIYWETPCGLPIKQGYRKYDTETIKTLIGDRLVFLQAGSATELGYNKIKQANSIAPNFVHSFDASALQKTVYDCVSQGIHSFAMIHDSYGTHAADAPLLAKTLRDSFVQMFGHTDRLKKFEEDLLKQYPEMLIEAGGKLPSRPAFGNLDVDDVKNSTFFFA